MTGKQEREAERILCERFGKDNVMALATVEEGIPYVRSVNALYDQGAFYIITHAASQKMQQIAHSPVVAIFGEWFSAHGVGVNLGYFGRPENAEIARKLEAAFQEWIDNGHNDFQDENTVILCVRLTDAVLFSHGTRYDLQFPS